MKPTPKTIQLFLPGGDPRGIRVAEITTRIVQLIESGDLLAMVVQDPQCSGAGLELQPQRPLGALALAYDLKQAWDPTKKSPARTTSATTWARTAGSMMARSVTCTTTVL
jgi:hypothetical protein